MLWRLTYVALALLCIATHAVRAASPSCFPAVEIPHAKIVRVEQNGVLVLADGRAARLEGIILPAGAADHAPDFYAEQAIAKLTDLATAHAVSLAAEAPKEDRYGRLRAQATTKDDGRWLQRTLLEEGLARVSVSPDRKECAAELYAAERHARAEKMGVWSSTAYRVRMPEQLSGDSGTFQIVEGTVQSVASGSGRIFLEFGHDRRRDFAIVITADDLRNFRAIGVDPYSYQKQMIRVRGWISRARSPEMEIATPADIEVMEAPDLRGSLTAP